MSKKLLFLVGLLCATWCGNAWGATVPTVNWVNEGIPTTSSSEFYLYSESGKAFLKTRLENGNALATSPSDAQKWIYKSYSYSIVYKGTGLNSGKYWVGCYTNRCTTNLTNYNTPLNNCNVTLSKSGNGFTIIKDSNYGFGATSDGLLSADKSVWYTIRDT